MTVTKKMGNHLRWLHQTSSVVAYVAGPLTTGPKPHWTNASAAYRVGTELLNMGVFPIVPHTSMVWDMVAPLENERDWLKWCAVILKRADCVVLSQPEAKVEGGTEMDLRIAEECGMPVFVCPEQLKAFLLDL